MQLSAKFEEFLHSCQSAYHALVRRLFKVEISDEEFLKKQLRAFPRWSRGHLRLARLAYAGDQAALCYASCQAVIQLGAEVRMVREAWLYLGKCHLLKREYQRALVIFQKLWEEDRTNQLREEIAACYFGMDQAEVAQKWLSDIPPSAISPEAQAVLNYCTQRQEVDGEKL
jgi:tetratricopeptide (TPR) repeat protein